MAKSTSIKTARLYISFLPPNETLRFLHLSGPLRSKARHDFFARDWLLSNSDTARVVDRVCDRTRHGSDSSFTETLDAVKPAWLKTIDEDLRLIGNIHNGRQAVRQVAYCIMLC